MRILNKILKNYGTYKNILQNNLTDTPLNNINSITYDGSNLYILINLYLFAMVLTNFS